MSENREDMNWDSAQQTHREIQEEILHSRNLELFEDVEPLLPLGKFPKCVEQEMPVDPWDPADQKVKRRLPGSQTITATKEKISRGYEIPEDAHEGFLSVAELLKLKEKGKAKGKKRARSPTPVESDDEEIGSHQEEAENELLYGLVGKAKGAAKKATSKSKKSDGPKSKNSKSTTTAAKAAKKPKIALPKETKVEKAERLEREDLDRRALEFFRTVGPIRRRRTTPPLTPPSSPPLPPPREATHLPPSPITDESLEQADVDVHGDVEQEVGTKNKLSPKTAALVGYSQIDAIDLSWDDDDAISDRDDGADEDDEMLGLDESRHRPRVPPLTHTRSAQMMPPPPIPASRPPSTTPSTNADTRSAGLGDLFNSPFSIRPHSGPRRALSSVSPAEAESVIPTSSEADSPVMPARRSRAAAQADPSPLAPRQRPQRQRGDRRRANPDQVKQLVSPPRYATPRPAPPSPPHSQPFVSERDRRGDLALTAEQMDLDVEVSGSSQSPDESSGEESESDRRFANNFQPTQAPKGYNQRAIYAAGLSTQAGPQQGLNFLSNQVAHTRKEAFFAKARKPVLLTDSEGSENEYELGSFVCDDDASVDFDSESLVPCRTHVGSDNGMLTCNSTTE